MRLPEKVENNKKGGDMKQLRELKKWWTEAFLTNYVICRNGIIGWLVYTGSSPKEKTRTVYDRTELLCKFFWFKKPLFIPKVNIALKCKGWKAVLLVRFYNWKWGKVYRFKKVELGQAVFITDLTGITAS